MELKEIIEQNHKEYNFLQLYEENFTFSEINTTYNKQNSLECERIASSIIKFYYKIVNQQKDMNPFYEKLEIMMLTTIIENIGLSKFKEYNFIQLKDYINNFNFSESIYQEEQKKTAQISIAIMCDLLKEYTQKEET